MRTKYFVLYSRVSRNVEGPRRLPAGSWLLFRGSCEVTRRRLASFNARCAVLHTKWTTLLIPVEQSNLIHMRAGTTVCTVNKEVARMRGSVHRDFLARVTRARTRPTISRNVSILHQWYFSSVAMNTNEESLRKPFSFNCLLIFYLFYLFIHFYRFHGYRNTH